jgi:hypothetical protein
MRGDEIAAAAVPAEGTAHRVLRFDIERRLDRESAGLPEVDVQGEDWEVFDCSIGGTRFVFGATIEPDRGSRRFGAAVLVPEDARAFFEAWIEAFDQPAPTTIPEGRIAWRFDLSFLAEGLGEDVAGGFSGPGCFAVTKLNTLAGHEVFASWSEKERRGELREKSTRDSTRMFEELASHERQAAPSR